MMARQNAGVRDRSARAPSATRRARGLGGAQRDLVRALEVSPRAPEEAQREERLAPRPRACRASCARRTTSSASSSKATCRFASIAADSAATFRSSPRSARPLDAEALRLRETARRRSPSPAAARACGARASPRRRTPVATSAASSARVAWCTTSPQAAPGSGDAASARAMARWTRRRRAPESWRYAALRTSSCVNA